MKRSLTPLALLLLTTTALADELPATLRWAEITTLSTPLSGRIGVVKVEAGDRVEKNRLLAALDPRPFQAEVTRAKAEVTRLRAQLKIAERELRHAEELYDRTVLSTTAMEDAQLRFETAQAALQRAEAALTLARLDLEYSQLRAPFAGIVTERNINPGESVSNRCEITPMIRLARSNRLIAVSRITPEQARQMARGRKITVTVAGRRFQGEVRDIRPGGGNPSLLELVVHFSADDVSAGDKATLEMPPP